MGGLLSSGRQHIPRPCRRETNVSLPILRQAAASRSLPSYLRRGNGPCQAVREGKGGREGEGVCVCMCVFVGRGVLVFACLSASARVFVPLSVSHTHSLTHRLFPSNSCDGNSRRSCEPTCRVHRDLASQACSRKSVSAPPPRCTAPVFVLERK